MDYDLDVHRRRNVYIRFPHALTKHVQRQNLKKLKFKNWPQNLKITFWNISPNIISSKMSLSPEYFLSPILMAHSSNLVNTHQVTYFFRLLILTTEYLNSTSFFPVHLTALLL